MNDKCSSPTLLAEINRNGPSPPPPTNVMGLKVDVVNLNSSLDWIHVCEMYVGLAWLQEWICDSRSVWNTIIWSRFSTAICHILLDKIWGLCRKHMKSPNGVVPFSCHFQNLHVGWIGTKVVRSFDVMNLFICKETTCASREVNISRGNFVNMVVNQTWSIDKVHLVLLCSLPMSQTKYWSAN